MKALVVDDDKVLADLVAFALRREGFEVIQAHDGESALQRWGEEKPELIILDVNLPKATPALDGFTVLRRIRERSDTPIIMLTVRGEEDDVVHGLQLGADDYVIKPFSPRQFVARIQAVMRRSTRGSGSGSIEAGDLHLDLDRREVQVKAGDAITLTALECRLLEYMLIYAGRILSIHELIDHVWGPGGGDRDMLRQLVRRLRVKIEPDPSQPRLIETIPGKGYGVIKSPGGE
jgi:DNA-binding response OmpR family regulator